LCKYVLSYLNLLITANSTEHEIEKAFELVCTILPKKDHEKCKEFIDKYAVIIVELIAELDDPNVICKFLGLCKETSKEQIVPVLKKKNLSTLPCTLCQYVVNYLDAIIKSNSSEVTIEKALDNVCKIVPEQKLKTQCELLVHLYGPTIVELLAEFADPKTVCDALNLCDKSVQFESK